MKIIRANVMQLNAVGIEQSNTGTAQGSTVDFDRPAFIALLSDKGYDVKWEKAMWCPNRVGDLKQRTHDITCTLCDGGGFIYFAEARTPMLMTGLSMQQSFNAYGRWDPGQLMVTALPEMTLNYWDRLTLMNGRARFFEMVTRQPETLFDALKYTPLDIEAVAWKDRTGALRRYTKDTDFEVDTDNGGVRWLTNTGIPDNNTVYSVAFTYRPRYIVLDLTHQIRDSTVNGEHYEFPTQAVAKLDFLIRDESKDAPQAQYQNPFPQR